MDVISSIIVTLVVLRLVGAWLEGGLNGVVKSVAVFVLKLPGMPSLRRAFTSREIKGFVKTVYSEQNKSDSKRKLIPIPEKGISIEDLKKELNDLNAGDERLSEKGKLFAYVYTAGGAHFELQKQAFSMFNENPWEGEESMEKHKGAVRMFFEAFMHDNALNPVVFPNLRKFENEIVSMTAHMLNGDGDTVGTVTSGGSESILMAVKTYRDRARTLTPHIKTPNIVAPASVHPAFDKAAAYFDVEIKHVRLDPITLQSKLVDIESAIDENTILLVGSAPSYPQAIMDQIEEISKIAERKGLPMHVDGCYGGFMSPWVEKLGHSLPKWDYRNPGVTSISADLHKYGYTTKGSSVITYRNESIRKYQYFARSTWSGGLFASPSMAGTRPGGHLAASWVALRAMGQDGFMEMAKKLLSTAKKMQDGVNAIEGLKVLGNPLITGFGFTTTSPKYGIFHIADAMGEKGWKTEVQTNPNSIHCTVLPSHIKSCDQWLKDLEEVVRNLTNSTVVSKSGMAALYGMVSAVPDDAMLDEFLVDLFSDIYK